MPSSIVVAVIVAPLWTPRSTVDKVVANSYSWLLRQPAFLGIMSLLAIEVAMISLTLLKLKAISLEVGSSTMVALKAISPLLTGRCSHHRLLTLVVIRLQPLVVASPEILIPLRSSRPSSLSFLQLSFKNTALGDQFIKVRDLHVADSLLNL